MSEGLFDRIGSDWKKRYNAFYDETQEFRRNPETPQTRATQLLSGAHQAVGAATDVPAAILMEGASRLDDAVSAYSPTYRSAKALGSSLLAPQLTNIVESEPVQETMRWAQENPTTAKNLGRGAALTTEALGAGLFSSGRKLLSYPTTALRGDGVSTLSDYIDYNYGPVLKDLGPMETRVIEGVTGNKVTSTIGKEAAGKYQYLKGQAQWLYEGAETFLGQFLSPTARANYGKNKITPATQRIIQDALDSEDAANATRSAVAGKLDEPIQKERVARDSRVTQVKENAKQETARLSDEIAAVKKGATEQNKQIRAAYKQEKGADPEGALRRRDARLAEVREARDARVLELTQEKAGINPIRDAEVSEIKKTSTVEMQRLREESAPERARVREETNLNRAVEKAYAQAVYNAYVPIQSGATGGAHPAIEALLKRATLYGVENYTPLLAKQRLLQTRWTRADGSTGQLDEKTADYVAEWLEVGQGKNKPIDKLVVKPDNQTMGAAHRQDQIYNTPAKGVLREIFGPNSQFLDDAGNVRDFKEVQRELKKLRLKTTPERMKNLLGDNFNIEAARTELTRLAKANPDYKKDLRAFEKLANAHKKKKPKNFQESERNRKEFLDNWKLKQGPRVQELSAQNTNPRKNTVSIRAIDDEGNMWLSGGNVGSAVVEGGSSYLLRVTPKGEMLAFMADTHDFHEGITDAVGMLKTKLTAISAPLIGDAKREIATRAARAKMPDVQTKQVPKNPNSSEYPTDRSILEGIANAKPDAQDVRGERLKNAGVGLMAVGPQVTQEGE